MVLPRKVATNFIENYGQEKFNKLIEDFCNNVPGPVIAKSLGVSRQRVHQWKQAFGKEFVIFKVSSEIEEMLGLGLSRRLTI